MTTTPNGHTATISPPTTRYAAQLRREGFARYRAKLLGDKASIQDFQEVADAFSDLPVDPYAVESNRFRRYSQLVYIPWLDELTWVPEISDPILGPVAEYWQEHYNPDFPGLRRRFPAISDGVKRNALLANLIRSNIEQVLWHDDLSRAAIYVGVHLIKLSVESVDQEAVSSPNCLHQDGGTAMFTFAHLVTRDNVVGGENVIAAPECAGRLPDEVAPEDILARFRLDGALDSYVVHDHRVSHYVSPVRLGSRSDAGSRGMIIMGIAPLSPKI